MRNYQEPNNSDFTEWWDGVKSKNRIYLQHFHRKLTPEDVDYMMGYTRNLVENHMTFKTLFPKGAIDREVHNKMVLDSLEPCGIYDYTSLLFLNFENRMGTLYYKYFGEEKLRKTELYGLDPSEIILRILELTVYSGKPTEDVWSKNALTTYDLF